MKKQCFKCSKKLDTSFFWRKKTKNGLDTYCKECRKIMQKKWLDSNREKRKKTQKKWYLKYKNIIREKRKKREKENPEKTKIQRRKYFRRYVLKKRYGITEDIFNQIFLKQQGKCAICGRSFKNYFPSVDHNHKTGKIRGLLCHKCNIHLGFYEKDKDFHKKVKEYLA